MSEAVFRIVAAGPHVSVQDGGRPGLMRYGVPASGAMDRLALRFANRALGNPEGAAAIEISIGGLLVECLAGAVTLALAGGGFHFRHGAAAGPIWVVRTIRAGETLDVRPGYWGNWCYLAVAGQLVAPVWLGSRSTHAQSGLGGGLLATAGEFTVADAEVRPDREGDLVLPFNARPSLVYPVVMGPQERCFPPSALAALLSSPFVLTDSYDRMGVRLAGPTLTPVDALAIPSEAVVRGSIQVGGDGAATVLLADHQTTGGYPKIATLVASAVDSFAQVRPRAPVRFRAIDTAAAVRLARRQAAVERGVLAALDRR